ncbi:MAG: leucine-rich repeat domain-containing protein, partial [Lachnospiraceae bacterium]|nr:leucine-rich repeat domain-containing protein [Lachnospiraceae bacterium]
PSQEEDALPKATPDGSDTDNDKIPAPSKTPSLIEEVLPTATPDGTDTSGLVLPTPQETPLLQEYVYPEEYNGGRAARDGTIPTPREAYEAMIALKDDDRYKEGTTWTNDEPYSESKGYYHWKGGPLNGTNISAAGCVAFAFTLSDAAFGSLPARMYAAGGFSFEDIKVGDILRVNNDAHTVIVLEVSNVGVVIAEGNLSTGGQKGKVHWGRGISKEEVMSSTSHYITRYPEGYVAPDDPEANVSIGAGNLDGGLAWNLTKAGTLTISGRGAMPDFSSTTDQPWSDNSSKIRKVVIEEGVTSIGSCAFWNCGVISVEISSSVASIGNSAFRGSSIISATIPSSVKTIGDSAFRACTSLTTIVLPASIEEMGNAVFFECTEMKSAAFAPGSKQVVLGDNVFMECWHLASVTLPLNIDRIGEGMFQNCLTLARVEIPQGAESIGGHAFASCSSLAAVVIPDSVTTIGIAAFSDSALADIYFTGTEAQWNSISKIGDTASAVSKATIHYNYIPVPSPSPSPSPAPDDGGNDNNTGGGNDNNTGGGNDNNTGGGNDNNTGGGNDNNTGGDNDNNAGDNTGGNPGGSPGGDKPGNNSGNTSSGNNPGSSSGGNAGNNTGSDSGRVKGTPGTSSIINSGIRAVVETWKPTTPDETKRYACMGKETVQYTPSKDNAYQIAVENAIQGPKCFQSFEAVLGDYTIGRTYNIYSLSDDIYSMDKEIEVTIKIPSAICKENREYKMICVTKGGQPIIYNDLDSDPETITIKTNKFYAYALIYK